MKHIAILLAGIIGAPMAFCQTSGTNPAARELWDPAQVPFSFVYNGVDSARLLPAWKTAKEDVSPEVRRYIYTDPQTHLRVTAEVRTYSAFPGVADWVLRFRNDGPTDTPILENILPLRWTVPASGDLFVRHARGSGARANDFEPLEEHIRPGEHDQIESVAGDPSSRISLPFFNLQTGDHGLILAIGWTGNWKADFENNKNANAISLQGGMQKTHLLLHPGEEIRTPRIVLMSWTGGDWQKSQNAWRRLLFAHYTPHDAGQPMRGPILFGSWGSEPIDNKLAYIQWVHEHQIPVELYAVDAGWYGSSFGAEMDPTNPWWKNRGDWFPSPRYYPHGIRPLGEALKAAGFGFSLWIEPETSMPNMRMVTQHPDWYLHSDHPANPGVCLLYTS